MPAIPRAVRRTALALGALATVVALGCLVLILWPDTAFPARKPPTPEETAAFLESLKQPYKTTPRSFALADGGHLAAQELPSDASTVIVLLHGVLGSAASMNRAAGRLREATGDDVIALDLRGHGASSGAPGDVDHIGQYEEDVGEVVAALRAAKPKARIILAGHSMGGGVALRYAQRRTLPHVDGYLLFAPHLGADAPTVRTGDASTDAAAFMKINVPRTIGLGLLTLAHVTAFNGLKTLRFDLPPMVPLRAYSFRAMVSAAPEAYRAALHAVEAPLLVIVGERDEAFVAQRFVDVVPVESRGQVVIVPGATHDGVLVDSAAIAAAREWLTRP